MNDKTPTQTNSNLKHEEFKAKDRKYRRLAIAFLVVSAGIVTLFVLAIFSTTSAPVKISNEFLNAVQANQPAVAYSLLADQAKKVVPEDQFEDVVKQIGPILNTQENITDREINGEAGSAATSAITYKIDGKDGNTYKMVINLTKEDGEWKVLNFESKIIK